MLKDTKIRSPWVAPFPESRAPDRVVLFCVPYAGGGASVFRQWQDMLPEHIQLCRLQLPGRENRVRETARTDLPSLIKECVTAILPCLENAEFAFYGHSMGTRVILEMAREIRRRTGREPSHLFFAACNPPHLPEPPPAHVLPDEDFMKVLRNLGGTPQEVLDDTELMNLFLPLLRADYALKERYSYYEEAPFSCAVTALSGRSDPETTREAMEEWRAYGALFSHVIFDGGHFFLRSHQGELLQHIGESLRRH